MTISAPSNGFGSTRSKVTFTHTKLQRNAVILKGRRGSIFFFVKPSALSSTGTRTRVGAFCSPALSLDKKISQSPSTSQNLFPHSKYVSDRCMDTQNMFLIENYLS